MAEQTFFPHRDALLGVGQLVDQAIEVRRRVDLAARLLSDATQQLVPAAGAEELTVQIGRLDPLGRARRADVGRLGRLVWLLARHGSRVAGRQ